MADSVRNEDAPDRGGVPASVAAPPRAIFGRYRVLARLGRGGMAEVFVTAAEGAAGVKKLAVVKRLRADLTKDEDPEAVEAADRFRSMFLAEAQLSARLNHPNIVHTYEVGEERGSLFIAMEYVEGQSLHATQSALHRVGTSIPPAMATRIVCEVLSGLHYAHELTDIGGETLVIVHRDVSPQNVMLTYDGGVKLVDFGVAKASRSSVSTEVGTIKGKIRYMAPEQVAGSNVDRRADLYAVGVLLWELLAEKRLVRGQNDAQALLSLVQDDAPSLLVEAPAVDPGLAAVVMRALSRSPDQRFQTALEMRSALEVYLAQSREHVTSETIGALVRTTFAAERERMAARVRKALSHDSNHDEGIVVDWGGEPSANDSGASKPPSRSGSRATPTRQEGTMPTVTTQVEGLLGPPPPFFPSVAPRQRSSTFLVPLVAFLAALAGAFAVIFLSKGWLDSSPPVTQELAATIHETPAPVALAPVVPSVEPRVATPAPPVVAPGRPSETERPVERAAASKGSSRAAAREARPDPAEVKREASAGAPEAGEKGFLTIDTYPWTKVSVNGRTLGTTPLVKSALPPGTYTVVLENPEDKISERVTVTIKPGETVSKRLAF